jgi:hypothetical protein
VLFHAQLGLRERGKTMATLYRHNDVDGSGMTVSEMPDGLKIRTSTDGYWPTDDEIPAIVSALQNYMSRKAAAITRERIKVGR